ncbi:MAG TPA: diacylglycerol kinase family protein [Dysgonamonadaceae bacterium]|nr:diacylglycerol kinase family protein [Dysgonamonadaceae bacterium]
MTKRVMNYIKGRLKSFSHAFNGMRILIKEERNTQIHVLLAVITLLFSFFFRISLYEWIMVSTMIGLVFAMEAINAAIENLSDYACNKEIHPTIKKVKDLSAAAVLLIALVALIVGCIIFIPKLLSL